MTPRLGSREMLMARNGCEGSLQQCRGAGCMHKHASCLPCLRQTTAYQLCCICTWSCLSGSKPPGYGLDRHDRLPQSDLGYNCNSIPSISDPARFISTLQGINLVCLCSYNSSSVVGIWKAESVHVGSDRCWTPMLLATVCPGPLSGWRRCQIVVSLLGCEKVAYPPTD